MHFLASIWVSQTGSPTVLCLPSCCLFHSMGKWSPHTCLFNKRQGPDRAVGSGSGYILSLLISQGLSYSDLPQAQSPATAFCGTTHIQVLGFVVYLMKRQPWLELGSTLYLPLHRDHRLTWNMCVRCHCRKTNGLSRSAQSPQPVASLINGNAPFSIPGSYCEDHGENWLSKLLTSQWGCRSLKNCWCNFETWPGWRYFLGETGTQFLHPHGQRWAFRF